MSPAGRNNCRYTDSFASQWPIVRQQLLDGTYEPSAARRKAIPKPDGSELVVNQQKSRTCSSNGVEFLGFRFEGYGGQIRVSPKNLVKFKDRVREITRRARGVSMKTRLQELGDYWRGWTGCFAIVPIKSFFTELDQWGRRRVRSCFWKQWRKPRTRIRNLLALGLPKDEAVPFGSSSRGALLF